MKAIFDKIFEIENLLNFDSENAQCFVDFDAYELNQTQTIENDIQVTKILDERHFIRFIATIPPSKSFNLHCHDCIEKIKVLAGELKDDKKSIIANINDEILYSRREVHKPSNHSQTDNCTILIDFYK